MIPAEAEPGARSIRDPAALTVFEESQARVQAMALIHEKLYQSSDFTRIDFTDESSCFSATTKKTATCW